MALRISRKQAKQAIIAVVFLTVAVILSPILLAVYIATGLYDVLRNEKRD